uniref:Glucagon / GIP / secretin / VIP family domain-containing protein n=1 Tax=Eptatretus burgeri TaxID=7764 RepID=A0A8C4QY56_EPTBU
MPLGSRCTTSWALLTLMVLLHHPAHSFPAAKETPEIRAQRHLDAVFTSAYKNILGELSAQRYLESLLENAPESVGQSNLSERAWQTRRDQDEEILHPMKRISDSLFTDNFSRYRKQKALQKLLSSTTGKRSFDTNGFGLENEEDPEVISKLIQQLSQVE